jgi:hypothetical protein
MVNKINPIQEAITEMVHQPPVGVGRSGTECLDGDS